MFDEVEVQIIKTTAIEGGVYDRRPANVDGFVKGKTSGFYFDKATGITVRNSSLQWGVLKPVYFAHLLESLGVKGLRVFNLAGAAAFPGKFKTQK